uniref:Small ubiquitin-related modifier 2 n=1 Tax=Osmerus mordax TaxID=8014 RepID=C1BLD4_OSMMO|nr:Small ubiquitin-related modifier 2 precursor [Osmerus mordax]
MADEKPKEGVKTENNDHINLKVAGQDGSVVQFKIKRHTPLSKLMKAYCERQVSMAGALCIYTFLYIVYR